MKSVPTAGCAPKMNTNINFLTGSIEVCTFDFYSAREVACRMQPLRPPGGVFATAGVCA